MGLTLDKLDRRILHYLKQDASVSLTKVAKACRVPEPTVYFRVNRLRSEGVIKRYTIVTAEDTGGPVKAAYLHTKDYGLSKMSERVVDNVGIALAAEPAVLFAARVERARIFVAWRGEDFQPLEMEGVVRVERIHSAHAYKALGQD